MAKTPPPDPLEFDPTARPAPAGPPQGRRQVPQRDKALDLDFSEVEGLDEQHRASRRPGAARMDPDSFLSRSEKEAMERARAAPRASLPNLIERDERSVGVRIVHRRRRYGVLLALGVALSALVVSAATWALSRWRAAATEREVQELRNPEALQRQREMEREKRIDR